MPILGSVLMEAEGDRLRLAATDLEVGIRAELEARVSKPGLMTAPARKLWEIVQESEAESVTLRALDNEQVEVRCGRAVFKMMSLDARSFPAMPSAEQVQESEGTKARLKVRPQVLRQMIDRVLFSASADESRYALNGVFVESPSAGMVRLVTTDGHRLAMIEREASGFALERGAILPRKGVGQIDKLVAFSSEDEVELVIESRLAWLKCGAAQLSMRLVEGEFPAYRAVIPSNPRYTIAVGLKLLQAAVKRAAIFSNDRFHGVKLHINGAELTVSSITPGLGEASDVIDIDFSGEEFSVGFNSSYLLQMMAVMPEEASIKLGLTDEVSPGLLTVDSDPSYVYVVMPMRL